MRGRTFDVVPAS